MTEPETTTPPRRRRHRLLLSVLLIAVGGLFGFGYVVTRPAFIAGRVAPLLEGLLGADVTIGRAMYEGDGRLVLEDLSIRSREHEGQAAEICRVGRASMRLNLSNVWRGAVGIESLDLAHVRLRVSEDIRHGGQFNFMGLAPSLSEDSGAQLPKFVQLASAVVEFGVHDGVGYSPRGARAFSGRMRSMSGAPETYDVTLCEVDDKGNVLDGGILARGYWNALTNEHTFQTHGVELDERTYRMCPRIAQLWWDRLDLSGSVASIDVGWSPVGAYSMSFTVADVGLTLPLETGEFWARYRDGQIEESTPRPRMHVNRGTIRLTPTRLVLEELVGELITAADAGVSVGVPYEVSVTISEMPTLDWSRGSAWMDEVLETAPFEMRFRTEAFQVRRDAKGVLPVVELPVAVARVLERFQFTDWSLSTSIRVWREAPERTPEGLVPGAIRSRGRAFIADAAGSYERFPYPLTDVAGYIEFDNTEILVHYVNGQGALGSNVRLSGRIAPPRADGEIDLRLTATGVPLDDELRTALPEGPQRLFDALLSRRAADGLARAGLLPSDAARPEIEAQLAEATHEHETVLAAGGVSERSRALGDTIARLRQRLDAGAFVLGGSVDLDLAITRPEHSSGKAAVSGLVKLHDLGLMFRWFPYPFWIPEGVIDCQPDRIAVWSEADHRGIPVISANGGRGELTGGITLHRDESGVLKMRPDLHIAVRNDALSSLVFAAIPPPRAEREAIGDAWPGTWESPAATRLRQARIEGSIDYDIAITSNDEGRPTFVVDLGLDQGTITPSEIISDLRKGRDEDPNDWRLTGCDGRVRIVPGSVELLALRGRHAVGPVTATGYFGTGVNAPRIRFDVDLPGAQLGPTTPGLLAASDRVKDWWARTSPRGIVNARIHYARDADGSEFGGEIEPRDIEFQVAGDFVAAKTVGRIRVVDRRLHFDDVSIDLAPHGGDGGVVDLRGTVSLPGATAPTLLEGGWRAGRFESPLVTEAVRLASSEATARRYEDVEPRGIFEATWSLAKDTYDSPGQYAIDLTPGECSLLIRDVPLEITPGEGARMRVSRGRIDIDRAEYGLTGGTLRAEGFIETGPAPRVCLSFDYDGRVTDPATRAILTPALSRVLSSLGVEESDTTRVRNAVLCLESVPSPTAADETEVTEDATRPPLSVDFEGDLVVANASLEAGVKTRGITGTLHVDYARIGNEPGVLDLSGRLDEAIVLGQELRDIEVSMNLSPDGRTVEVPMITARAGEGRISVRAASGVGDDRAYEANVKLAGVPLSGFRVGRPAPDGEDADSGVVPDDAPGPVLGNESGTGRVYASIDVRGERGRPETRTGRGVARIVGDQFASVPGSLQLLQLLHMTLPRGNWDYADTDFFIAGDRIMFEKILFESTVGDAVTQELRGHGVLDLATNEIDARFTSRGGVIIVRDLLGGIGDRLAAIEVKGPVWDPEARLVPLPDVSERVGAPPIEERVEGVEETSVP